MRVLVACEFSGTVRDAFLARGHDAISCDLLPTESPGPHIQGDVLPLLAEPWDMVIAHPPCNYLSNARLPWLNRDPLWKEHTAEGAAFFLKFFTANAPKVAIENPRMHMDARKLVPRPATFVEPWEHGHPYTKHTQLWLRGLPPLMASRIVVPEGPWVCSDSGRGVHVDPKMRAKTFPGIAKAMAEQWG